MPQAASDLSHLIFEHVWPGAVPDVVWVVFHAGNRETQMSPLPSNNFTKSMVPNVTQSVFKCNCPLCDHLLREIEELEDAVVFDSQGPAPRCYRQKRPFGLSSLNLHHPLNSTSQRRSFDSWSRSEARVKSCFFQGQCYRLGLGEHAC
jgi:hypothetical protein